jgi:phosphatidylinositol-3-phosphatase
MTARRRSRPQVAAEASAGTVWDNRPSSGPTSVFARLGFVRAKGWTVRLNAICRAGLPILLLILGITAAACAGGAVPTAPSPTTGAPPGESVPRSQPARPDHVVVVVLENKDAQDVLRSGPYLRSLATTGASLTDMHAETHPSQPNYLALFSGDTHGVRDDRCPLAIGGPSLAGELRAAGFSFTGYAEDLPHPGFSGCKVGDYARKHSPWTDFSDVPVDANQPISAMPLDFTQLPTVSFVIPNLCHDVHDCPIAEGDRWLAENIDPYARWARSHNSLLIVTFDESEQDDDLDNHIATFAVGARVTPGPVAERADHYRLLRTLEDLYGLRPLGHSAGAASIGHLWSTGT